MKPQEGDPGKRHKVVQRERNRLDSVAIQAPRRAIGWNAARRSSHNIAIKN